MIRFTHKGSFSNTERFLNVIKRRDYLNRIDQYAQEGVEALRKATPVDTGKTAASWDYEIESNGSGTVIHWTNSNTNEGVCIAVIIQYGHGQSQGGYVEGIDYVNPALKPVFQEIADKAWKEVRQS